MTIELPQLSDGAIEFARQLERYSRENRPYLKDGNESIAKIPDISFH